MKLLQALEFYQNEDGSELETKWKVPGEAIYPAGLALAIYFSMKSASDELLEQILGGLGGSIGELQAKVLHDD